MWGLNDKYSKSLQNLTMTSKKQCGEVDASHSL